MKTMIKIGMILLLIVSTQVFSKVATIPVEDFFKTPEFSGLQLSPNGKFIAVLSPINDRRNIVIMDTDGLSNIKPITGFKKQNVAGFYWANDKDIVFTLDSDGNEAFSIYTIDTSKRKPKVVKLVGAIVDTSGIRSANTVHTLPDDPDHIIVQYNGRRVTAPDLFKVPLDSKWSERGERNGKMEMIARNPGDVQGWILDHDGAVRGAYSIEGLKGKFLYKEAKDEEFTLIKEFNVDDESITPLGFAFDNKTMYVTSNIGRDTSAIYTYDPIKRELGEMIYGHDVVDVTGLITSRKEKKLLGVSYFYEYPETVYFDKRYENLKKSLMAAFPNKQVNITSTSEDEMLNIVAVSSDSDPGRYFLFDIKTNSLKALVPTMEWLNPADMVPMKPIKFESRDGLTMHGYLTMPKNVKGKVPLIVNPHGGPFGIRDFWGFNPEHQFFANRGYATVQVNFRGSGGYGLKFQKAGYGGKWGAEMQNDITDTVKYLVDEGIVDPDKVCIYGASYGGYATMAGLTFTPDLFKCGINYVGVTDVGLLFESMPKHWEPQKELMKVRIGDPEDEALMKRMSPLAHVDKIKAPLMIIQGARDPRVVKKHATDLRSALEARDIELDDDEWIMKKNEGHGFRKQENVMELYNKIDKFLAKHLK